MATRKYPNEVIRDEHDETLNAKKVSIISGAVGNATVNVAGSATIYAVVNAGSGGTSATDDSAFTVDSDSGTPFMGLYESSEDVVDNNDVGVVGMTANRWLKTSQQSSATIFAVVNTTAAGQASVVIDGVVAVDATGQGDVPITLDSEAVVLGGSVAGIGFATVHQGDDPWNVAVVGNVTVDQVDVVTAVTDITNPIAIKGNMTLSDSKTYVGLATITAGRGHQYIGLATVRPVGLTTVVQTGNTTVIQADVSRTITGNITLSDAKTYIGLTTSIIGNPTTAPGVFQLYDDASGPVDVASTGSDNSSTDSLRLKVRAGAEYFNGTGWDRMRGDTTDGLLVNLGSNNDVAVKGNVTVSVAGPAQTIVPQKISLSEASIATIAIPTTTFKITSMVMNSDATVRVSIKSGATYLTGNATIGITLNPGGGFVKDGTIDSPSFTGLANAEAIVIEKFDMTGTSANIGGYLSYYED